MASFTITFIDHGQHVGIVGDKNAAEIRARADAGGGVTAAELIGLVTLEGLIENSGRIGEAFAVAAARADADEAQRHAEQSLAETAAPDAEHECECDKACEAPCDGCRRTLH